MALIKQSVNSLINGVSQQPASTRIDSQCSEQVNGLSSVIDGVAARPGSEIIAEVQNPGGIVNNNRAKLGVVSDSDGNDYIVVLDGEGGLQVFDDEGVPQTVTIQDDYGYDHTPTIGELTATDYLNADSPSSFSLSQAGDNLFILNTEKVVKYYESEACYSPYNEGTPPQGEVYNKNEVTLESCGYAPMPSDLAIFWVKQANERAKYDLVLQDVTLPNLYPANTYASGAPFSEWDGSPYTLTTVQPDPIPNQATGNAGSDPGKFEVDGNVTPDWKGIGEPLVTESTFEIDFTSETVSSIERIASGVEGAAASVVPDQISPAIADAFNAWAQAHYDCCLEGAQGIDESSGQPTGLFMARLTPNPTNSVFDGFISNWKAVDTGANGVVIIYPVEPTSAWGDTTREASDIFTKATQGTFVSASDSSNYTVCHKTCGSLEELPLTGAPDGFMVKVVGEASSTDDDFFVQYSEEDGWKEVSGSNWQSRYNNYEYVENPSSPWMWEPQPIDPEKLTKTTLHVGTMPHVLEKQEDGTWLFGAANWAKRNAGNENTLPGPSFANKKLVDIAVHKNRLVLATEDSFVFSQSGELLNFFQQSARDVLDTDPIDVVVSAANTERGIGIFAMTSFDQDLFGFGETGQVVLSGSEDLFTPSTVGADVASYLDCSPRVNPIVVGNRTYFVGDDKSSYSRIYEYGKTSARSWNAAEVTSAIPKYIPDNVDILTGSLDENTLIAGSIDSLNELFVYRQYFAGKEKAQSCWSRWTFDESLEILDVTFRNDVLYMVTRHPGDWSEDGQPRIWLERLPIEPDIDEPDVLDYTVRLDHKVKLSTLNSVFDAPNYRTRYELPGEFPTSDGCVVIGGPNKLGFVLKDLTIEIIDGSRWFWAPGVQSEDDTYYIGRLIDFRYLLSPLYYQTQDGSGTRQPYTLGRMQLKRIRAGVKDSGTLEVQISPEGRPQFTKLYVPTIVNQDSIGAQPIEDYETFDFDVGCDARKTEIQFQNKGVTPSTLIQLEWHAMLFDKYTGRPRGAS